MTARRDRARDVVCKPANVAKRSRRAIGPLLAALVLAAGVAVAWTGIGVAQSANVPSAITTPATVSASWGASTTPTPPVTQPAASDLTALATTNTTITTTTPPTTTPTTSPAPALPPDVRLGSRGPAVVTLQQALVALSYQPGRTDGVFDAETREAVIAFQKVEGLPRDGQVWSATWTRLLSAKTPSPRLSAPGTRVEVDLTHQVLLYIENNQVVKTLACSTGKPGWRTPPGHYSVYRKIPVWHQSALGWLYKPCYVHGGIAIHGEDSVPVYPGSHGCIRVTPAEMNILYAQLPIGLRVDVYY